MTISKPADAIENRCIAGFKALQESCNAIHPVTLTAVGNATVTTDKYDIYRHYSTISERLVTVIVGSTPQRSKTASGERLTQTASCLVKLAENLLKKITRCPKRTTCATQQKTCKTEQWKTMAKFIDE